MRPAACYPISLFVNPTLFETRDKPAPKRLLTEADLDGNFARRDVVHARDLAHSGTVLRIEVERPGWVIGRVSGDDGIEEQLIEVGLRAREVYIEAWCTCPQRDNCIHAAAVLLAGIREPGIEVPVVNAEARVSPTEPFLERWLNTLEDGAEASAGKNALQSVLYILKPVPGTRQATLEVVTAKRAKAGGWSKPFAYRASTASKLIAASELELIEALTRNLTGLPDSPAKLRLEGFLAAHLLAEVIATGRCHWESIETCPLKPGSPKTARLEWTEQGSGSQVVEVRDLEGEVLAMSPPFYVDMSEGTCGQVDFGVSPEVAEALLLAPTVFPEHAARVRKIVGRSLADRPEYWPAITETPRLEHVQPIPILTIGTGFAKLRDTWVRAARGVAVRWATLEFEYAGFRVGGSGGGPIRSTDGKGPVVIPRQIETEAAAWERLGCLDWIDPETARGMVFEGIPDDALVLMSPSGSVKETDLEQLFFGFLGRVVPTLESEGWRIELKNEERPRLVRAEAFEGRFYETGNDWFNVNVGAQLGAEVLDLRPILPAVFDRILRAGDGDEWGQDGGDLYVRAATGELVCVPVARLKPIVQGLVELFGRPEKWDKEFKLPVARAGEAAILGDAAEKGGFRWKSSGRLKEVTERLRAWQGITALAPPKGFVGELRGYQQEGAGWLRFLSEFGLGGILADDMGLGKTVQTLAHIVAEKEAGRLDLPVLVVGPTSTLPNWEAEIARFAPTLKCLKLHGPDRVPAFSLIPQQDIVLTSYPLLARDGPLITQHEFHLAVLDEAQNIKNPTTKVAKTAFELKARHRVALSGTPIENNLQELWSLFKFALPDLFGNAQEFKSDFRQPIEVEGNRSAQELLTRRIRPFVLRRTKGQVASELPPKTIILDRVEMEETQRDLYESVRLAMDEKVRKLFAGKGFERSRIEVLDALLKLRQVCCDPRLVKLPSAAGVTASAKLERLIDVLTELSGEGRKVLVFSQFTSMLDLIEPRLRELKIGFVRLTGQTKDRAEPVKLFQTGDVPVFLISLKAGGTGLNLTAADTVIHYDPWWNPAVENQATDRAHRIGQDKPVFVYKLVAVNTVEEKILDLQEKKADLAERLLAGTTEAAASLTMDDLRWLVG